MKKFKEIYNDELTKIGIEDDFIQSILGHVYVRQFVYEICKRILLSNMETQNNLNNTKNKKSDDFILGPTS